MHAIRLTNERRGARHGDRLVQRYRTEALDLTWAPKAQGALRSRPKPVPVKVLDLSVDGALFVAPVNPLVRRGTVVPIESRHGKGTVQVRHVHHRPDGDRQYCGVKFLDLDEPLRAWLYQCVAHLRGDDGELEGRWNWTS